MWKYLYLTFAERFGADEASPHALIYCIVMAFLGEKPKIVEPQFTGEEVSLQKLRDFPKF